MFVCQSIFVCFSSLLTGLYTWKYILAHETNEQQSDETAGDQDGNPASDVTQSQSYRYDSTGDASSSLRVSDILFASLNIRQNSPDFVSSPVFPTYRVGIFRQEAM